MNFYRNPTTGIGDTGRKVLRSLCKVPLFTDHHNKTKKKSVFGEKASLHVTVLDNPAAAQWGIWPI
jgi:hypothetical protein